MRLAQYLAKRKDLINIPSRAFSQKIEPYTMEILTLMSYKKLKMIDPNLTNQYITIPKSVSPKMGKLYGLIFNIVEFFL